MTITKSAAPVRQSPSTPLATAGSSTAATVYRTLALIVGAIVLVVGVGALWGGRFADSFIAEEMARQNITMPSEQAIDSQLASQRIDQQTADELRPYADLQMADGNHAKAYAGYIQDHMAAAGAAAGLPAEQATYSGIGAAYGEVEAALTAEIAADHPKASEEEVAALTAKEIADPTSDYETAREAAGLKALRFDTMFNGNMLVGTLLNVYGWGLIGTIATWAGLACLVIGPLLILGGSLIRPKANR
ncbi:hypothetical protein [Corynebacterium guangdongense]|uniref:DUF4349 domain-containing protein n=1 Tax=Corynebacterium guangdongense TaxID=1783348 RepID=A0ABU1ZWL4_9CORY|nr:hypothetical protein [Corynebacterium guangdongense]MDR7329295.1 hypothetical protein [Corynebacterium guangdongense]WJZ17861.1 hypothetical protein CGUA_06450 [Corynebacterium guangdongense]